MVKYNKWKSRRFQITLWSLFVLTSALFMEYEPNWLTLIAGIPIAYIAGESYTKTHRKENA